MLSVRRSLRGTDPSRMKRIVHRIGSMCEFSIGGFLPW
jgi:hypothetical protein